MVAIGRLSRAPIVLVGDVLQAGTERALEVLERLRRAKLDNEIVFEFLDLPPVSFLRQIDRHVSNWSMELSPDSHDQQVRLAQDGEPAYSNEEMEAVFREALSLSCRRVDVFFMIGLPQQTRRSVMETIDYCDRLFRLFDRRLACFISPMGPFIDPGSRGFEEPERFGYRLFARTLEEHRQLLVQPTWERILNYETIWMTRRELVDATYDAAERLNDLKRLHRRVSAGSARAVARDIEAARRLRERLDAVIDHADGPATSPDIEGDIARFSMSTVCDKRELFWPRHLVNFRVTELARLAGRYLGRRALATIGR